MAKCMACAGRIFFGGEKYAGWTFCNADCIATFKIGVSRSLFTEDQLAQRIAGVFQGACPQCRKAGPVDIYTSDRVTGLLVAYHVSRTATMSCVACGKRAKWLAAVHCGTIGWWSLHGFIYTLLFLPKNIIGALAVRAPAAPSAALIGLVMRRLAETNIATYKKRLAQQAREAAGTGTGTEAPPAISAEEERMAVPEDRDNPYRAGR